MICNYESIELVSKEKDGDIYILENFNPGKPGYSEWVILDHSRTGPNEFKYSEKRGMASEKRKELNDILEGYLSSRVITDDPVLCLDMSKQDFLECKEKIKNLLNPRTSDPEKRLLKYFRDVF